MNYIQLQQAIQDYASNTETVFVQNIPTFVQEAEDRIYNSVQIPALRKNVNGVLTTSNPYLSLPNDWLANYSFAVVDSTGSYSYLLNKDVNFIREAFPNATVTGTPQYYGLFGSQLGNTNEMSLILGPTPDQNYNSELHYFYYPPTIVQGIITTTTTPFIPGSGYTSGIYTQVPLTGGQGYNAQATIVIAGGIVIGFTITNGGTLYVVGDVVSFSASAIGAGAGVGFSVTVSAISNVTGTSWLGDNYDPALFYGAMREAMIFMKGEADMVGYYEQRYQEALLELKRLGDGLERGDAYRDGQTKIPVKV